MFKFTLILLLLIFTSSCSKNKDIINESPSRYFIYKNLKINIPNYFQVAHLVKSKWIDKENGVTLNINIESSKENLDDYCNNAIITIKKIYSDYKVLNNKKLNKNKIFIISSTKIENIMLKFYMLIISFDKSKVIITIGGREEYFNNKRYKTFINSIKVGEVSENEDNN